MTEGLRTDFKDGAESVCTAITRSGKKKRGIDMGLRWTEEQYQKYIQKQGSKNIFKPQNKKSKYNNRKTVVDGITFDSKKEADYYCALKLLKQSGEIRDFGLQPKYELQPAFEKNGKKYRPITYVADFVIVNNDGTTEVVDVKGVETQVFKIKKKMFEYQYPELELKIVKEV